VNPVDGLTYVPIPGAGSIAPFWMGATEVPVDAYLRFTKAAGMAMPEPPAFNPNWSQQNHPIVKVTWTEATAFCEWAGGRLPTSPEWELAARGGLDNLKYPWGSSLSRASANYGSDRCCDGAAEGADTWKYTAPVGSFPANRFGLYNMLGNVAEWTSTAPEGAAKPGGNAASERRIVRGGAWSTPGAKLQISEWEALPASAIAHDVGFRCVAHLAP
jgi:formylglycine-generating enzyme required for sulfatase activity